MSWLQSFLTSILPPAWARDLQAESQRWTLRCTCGHERSVWECGGVRWKASGSPRRLLACPRCGQTTWHKTYFRAAPPGAD